MASVTTSFANIRGMTWLAWLFVLMISSSPGLAVYACLSLGQGESNTSLFAVFTWDETICLCLYLCIKDILGAGQDWCITIK